MTELKVGNYYKGNFCNSPDGETLQMTLNNKTMRVLSYEYPPGIVKCTDRGFYYIFYLKNLYGALLWKLIGYGLLSEVTSDE